MPTYVKDPALDLVRTSFVRTLSRLCLLLALAHFTSVVPLYFLMTSHAGGEVIQYHYITTLLISGIVLLAIGLLCKLERAVKLLSILFFITLFAQLCFLLSKQGNLISPVTMCLLPLVLCAAPVFGRRSAYLLAIVCSILLINLYFFSFDHHNIWELVLMNIALFVSAHIAEVLWAGVLHREIQLEAALEKSKNQTKELELWIERLMEAESLICNTEKPNTVFKHLTRDVAEANKKLRNYFQELLLSNRLTSIGMLATGIAHELNTPLTTLEFIVEREEHLSDQTKQDIRRELARMSAITRELLSFARAPQKFELVNLTRAIKEALALFCKTPHKTAHANLEICFTPPQAPVFIKAVPNHITQVLLNLFENAWDAASTVKTPRLEIVVEGTEQAVMLRVTDNGIGIAKSNLSLIFEPFFTTKDPGKGTGLGLFLVHGILTHHRATIEVESTEGTGTKFSILFSKPDLAIAEPNMASEAPPDRMAA